MLKSVVIGIFTYTNKVISYTNLCNVFCDIVLKCYVMFVCQLYAYILSFQQLPVYVISVFTLHVQFPLCYYPISYIVISLAFHKRLI